MERGREGGREEGREGGKHLHASTKWNISTALTNAQLFQQILVVSQETCSHSTYNWLLFSELYRDQNSPGGVVETETGVAGGSDCGPVTVGERGEEGGRERGKPFICINGIQHHSSN